MIEDTTYSTFVGAEEQQDLPSNRRLPPSLHHRDRKDLEGRSYVNKMNEGYSLILILIRSIKPKNLSLFSLLCRLASPPTLFLTDELLGGEEP